MAEGNVETVRKHLAALNERDLGAYLATCTEDVELWSLLSAVEGPYVGADGIRRFFRDIGDAASEASQEIVRLEAVDPDRVISVERWSATGRSSRVAAGEVFGDEAFSVGTVYEFADGKIKRIRVFADVQETLSAVGLSE